MMATTKDGRTIDVERDTDLRRFRARVGDQLAGEAEFLLTPELVVFTHTEVDPAFEGQGIGSVLIRWALDDVRKDGYAVVPSCPFVRSFIDRHAEEYADLVYRRPDESAAS
jgi:hypothetical protein